MNRFFTILCCFIGMNALYAQDCTGGRYYTEIFTTLDSAVNITYGQAPNGQSLELDYWKPSGDMETNRPLIIMAHGGSFIGGSKEDLAIRMLCRMYARMGYVAVSMEYRLLTLDSVFMTSNLERTFLQHVYRSVHDQMAAIRFFRKSVAEDGNPYGINPNLIIVGGISAGAILGMQTTYMDSPAKLPALIAESIDGGFFGNSGNPGYSSVPQAVLNYCGALKDTSHLGFGDQPMVSIHGTADDVVPYGTDYARPMPGVDLTLLSGSGDVAIRASHVGVDNPLLTYVGRGHCDFWANTAQSDSTNQFVKDFLEDQICIKHLYENNQDHALYAAVYPNPTTGILQVDLPGNEMGAQIQIINALGAVLHSEKIPAHTHAFSLDALSNKAPGMYWLKINSGSKSTVLKVLRK